jgi:hypothetical protein
VQLQFKMFDSKAARVTKCRAMMSKYESEGEAMPVHPGLTTWNRADYAAGFRARLAEAAASETAPNAWRCGWEDADTDVRESVRHRRVLAAGGTDDHEEAWYMLFDAGGDARVNGVEFDENRTDPWKEGWIDADIKLGTLGR